ncbi:beta-ketoacyl-[acyl-carrier-protein] synthase family protein [Bremerella alba]|uniref:Actinorhodin polyketide putative beta-ketoacyl synthase 1 n=1 Tax=Bremerella alba TaxID=980252 RepID=A0A7V9A7Y1_9BACT|nr:beta-ketoacyl-[acyl-carrier-protein] synthase family protein [Bremerella alba]MBA2115733.1 Actinorhodin polyketide putative beta-ketoacyl synthase 1 [Bremerella alba]
MTKEDAKDPVVITGIGLITSVGKDRESTWASIQRGTCGIRRMTGISPIEDNLVLGAPVDLPEGYEPRLKILTLNEIAAAEALKDAQVDLSNTDRTRFGCAVSAGMGDARSIFNVLDLPGATWPVAGGLPHEQFFPCTPSYHVAHTFGLEGPRLSHSTACASGLVELGCAVRAIRDRQCDIALAGSAEAIDPLFVAGFRKMRVLSDDADPTRACRPFDKTRNGFVIGEGAAMFVVERLSHALSRGAKIYSEVLGCRMLAEAHHMTGIDMKSDALERLLRITLKSSDLGPRDVDYINCHGTGTQQNDVNEARGIRAAFGPFTNRLCASSIKSMVGHSLNASGSIELAMTALALRDGFVPPTSNLRSIDPEVDMDCVPLVGREQKIQHALKLSVAFGGHLVAVALRRWNDSQTGFAYPERRADDVRRAA